MTDIIPWALVAILYALGGFVIYEDMKQADLEETDMLLKFQWGSYVFCVGLWPLLVAVVIMEKIKDSRS